MRSAAEGVKNHSSNVATWMKKNVNPTLRNILPASSDSPSGEPQPSTSAAVYPRRPVSFRNIHLSQEVSELGMDNFQDFIKFRFQRGSF